MALRCVHGLVPAKKEDQVKVLPGPASTAK